jgi:membrane-associated phospholipid phosphatase
VDPASFDVAALLPPPPVPGSLAAQGDLETVRQAQAWRTPAQVAWAQVVDHGDTFAWFGADHLLGPKFTAQNLPRLAAFMNGYGDELDPMDEAAKKIFARPRPFVVDPRVQPCVERLASSSYPSGHALFAYLDAAVLAEIFPAKRTELFERAHRVAWSRVLGGAHFPTDLEAGRRLAGVVIAAELKNPAFRAALDDCRREVAAVMP